MTTVCGTFLTLTTSIAGILMERPEEYGEDVWDELGWDIWGYSRGVGHL